LAVSLAAVELDGAEHVVAALVAAVAETIQEAAVVEGEAVVALLLLVVAVVPSTVRP
jgi:hypothetical protein